MTSESCRRRLRLRFFSVSHCLQMESVLPTENAPPCCFQLCTGEVLVKRHLKLYGKALPRKTARRDEQIH